MKQRIVPINLNDLTQVQMWLVKQGYPFATAWQMAERHLIAEAALRSAERRDE